MKGNEQDCICEKPNGKHRKHCDAFRLSEFEKKCASVVTDNSREWEDVIRLKLNEFSSLPIFGKDADSKENQKINEILEVVTYLLDQAYQRGAADMVGKTLKKIDSTPFAVKDGLATNIQKVKQIIKEIK